MSVRWCTLHGIRDFIVVAITGALWWSQNLWCKWCKCFQLVYLSYLCGRYDNNNIIRDHRQIYCMRKYTSCNFMWSSIFVVYVPWSCYWEIYDILSGIGKKVEERDVDPTEIGGGILSASVSPACTSFFRQHRHITEEPYELCQSGLFGPAIDISYYCIKYVLATFLRPVRHG